MLKKKNYKTATMLFKKLAINLRVSYLKRGKKLYENVNLK